MDAVYGFLIQAGAVLLGAAPVLLGAAIALVGPFWQTRISEFLRPVGGRGH